MIGIIESCAITGIEAEPIRIEVDISSGLPSYHVVGLPTAAVREGAVRIRSALKNIGHALPPGRVTINLAPADIRKDGADFDLPIALALLIAAQKMRPAFLKDTLVWGELGLDGGLRAARGGLAVAMLARKLGRKRIIVPHAAGSEAAVIEDVEVLTASHIADVIGCSQGSRKLTIAEQVQCSGGRDNALDMADVSGQPFAKVALEVAAAGGHNVLMVGPPGVGKSMLAKRLPSILPPLTNREGLEVMAVRSAASKPVEVPAHRPFRSPHHTISSAALVGGGTIPSPGEVTLAHRGILFLDELNEFPRHLLETLRQPLEDRELVISRSWGTATLPSDFMLVGACNPCPCGWLTDPKQRCVCSERAIQMYRKRISGPLLDRLDVRLVLRRPPLAELMTESREESSQDIRTRVIEARQRQESRLAQYNVTCNANMSGELIRKTVSLTASAEKTLMNADGKYAMLTARGLHRLIRVAQTIADLSGHDRVENSDVLEALAYRLPPAQKKSFDDKTQTRIHGIKSIPA